MMGTTQRSRDIARAALLRERVLGALRGAPDSMTLKQLCDWPSIAELYHARMLPHKVHAQLGAGIKQGIVEKVGRAIYKAVRQRPEEEQPADALSALNIVVNKAERSIALRFGGLSITIKVE